MKQSILRKTLNLISVILLLTLLALLAGCKSNAETGQTPEDDKIASDVNDIDLSDEQKDDTSADNGQATDNGIEVNAAVEKSGKYMNMQSVTSVSELTTTSPDGTYEVWFWKDDKNKYYYSVLCNSEIIIDTSAIGIKLKDGELVKGLNYEKGSSALKEINETYETIVLSASTAVNHCNERRFTLSNGSASFDFVIRVYDDGIAYRYENVKSGTGTTVTVFGEVSEFMPVKDTTTWALGLNATYEGEYVERSYSTLYGTNAKFTTPLLATNSKYWMLLSEAGVFNNNGDYCKSSLKTVNGSYAFTWSFGLARDPAKEATGDVDSPGHKEFYQIDTRNGFNTPWRAAIITDNLEDLYTSSLISDLNPAPDKTLYADTSWIKPGKVAWSWWAESNSQGNYNKHVEYVDFASKNGWEYVCLDAGWRNFEGRLKELCDYAKSKNVGIFVWVNYRDVTDYSVMEKLFSKWKEAGVVGLKTDYFESDEQAVLNVMEEIARCTARHKLMVLYHGCFSPCGEYRTYPNILSMEAVMGEEYRKWSDSPSPKNCLVYPFTRNIVGPMDYTPVGLKITKVEETNGFSLAKTVIYQSGLQHFAHAASVYKSYIGLPFLNNIPVTWDKTLVIEGIPGEIATFARLKADNWFLGSMTLKARKLDIALDFLGEGEYNAYIYKDSKDGSSLELEERVVTSTDRLAMDLLNCGGVAVMLTKSKINTTVEDPLSEDTGKYQFYEAESQDNTLTGAAVIASSALCSGGQKVGYVGNGAENALQFNIKVEKDGTYRAVLYYCSGEDRDVTVTVNADKVFDLTGLNSGSYDQPDKIEFDVKLKAGKNTITLTDAKYYAPDFDKLAISKN